MRKRRNQPGPIPQVVVDTSGASTLVTSRKPDDLKAFNSALLDAFAG